MSDKGKQSPLGVNSMGSLLQNKGLTINPVAQAHMGISKTNTDYTFGSVVSATCLRLLTWAINDAYVRLMVGTSTYDNLIHIGSMTIPALGNTLPSTYKRVDPSGMWWPAAGTPATTGYGITSTIGQGQEASWLPYDTTNPNVSVTQWGYNRLFALQAWNEFNWNGIPAGAEMPQYKDFLLSFMSYYSFVEYSNTAILSAHNSKPFMDGTYSNMNDLISADLLGVNLATPAFGQDLVASGKALNLSTITSFGLPSNLLRNLQLNNAITQAVSLALLTSGLTVSELGEILGNILQPTTAQQRIMYDAFKIIVNQDLIDVLIPLNCKTRGLTSLADLLNPQKLFPLSGKSLTVPVYNTTTVPTNSKTYYPIYENGALNSRLTSAGIASQIGTQILPGTPAVTSRIQVDQTSSIGFGSYLTDILPNDLAVAAGAFSATMQQIRNISSVPVEKLGQIAGNIETTTGLDLINGTTVPVTLPLANDSTRLTALGSGPYGTYTMSDMFGCMSGLPYLWKDIQSSILGTQTPTLLNIYNEQFLAVTWEGATADVTYSSYVVESPPTVFTTWYTVTGLSITNRGGGYGRGTAPKPVITISNGGSALGVFGTDNKDAGSVHLGTFGRVTGYANFVAGPDSTSIPTATIQAPPTQAPGTIGPVLPTGYSNSPAGTPWSMDSVIQNYIDQANAEILLINGKSAGASMLNKLWDDTGTQLTIEQRARYIGSSPVPVPRNIWMSSYPTTIYSFVDSTPTYSHNTSPHMSAQTLEAISNLTLPGGQSIVGMMREARNNSRLLKAGIYIDDNIPDKLESTENKILVANGSLAGSNPAMLSQISSTGAEITTAPNGYYDPTDNTYYSYTIDGTAGVFGATGTGAGGTVGSDTLSGSNNPGGFVGVPVPVDTGQTIVPGSFAGSPYQNLIPSNIDVTYTSDVLLPATYTPDEAVNEVTTCNCDCWQSP